MIQRRQLWYNIFSLSLLSLLPSLVTTAVSYLILSVPERAGPPLPHCSLPGHGAELSVAAAAAAPAAALMTRSRFQAQSGALLSLSLSLSRT